MNFDFTTQKCLLRRVVIFLILAAALPSLGENAPIQTPAPTPAVAPSPAVRPAPSVSPAAGQPAPALSSTGARPEAVVSASATQPSPAQLSPEAQKYHWSVSSAPLRAVVRAQSNPQRPETGIEISLPELGQVRPDMADLLLSDTQGNPLPLAKLSTRPGGRVELLAQNLSRGTDYYLYFGGNQPRNAPSWTPQTSLFMETRRAPAVVKYDTFQNIKAAWDAATEVDGAGFVPVIFTAENPYGFSYNFLTHYTGYLPISNAKPILFFTISSDASFVLFNDQLEFGWPGQHQGGCTVKTLHSKAITCPGGVVKVDYYAAKGDMTFGDHRDEPSMVLGWKGEGENYGVVDWNAWLHPGLATVSRIENPHGLVVPIPNFVPASFLASDDQWLFEVSFSLNLRAAQLSGWTATWEFEDGAMLSGLQPKRILAGLKPQLVKVHLKHGDFAITETLRVHFSENRMKRASIKDPADMQHYVNLILADDVSQIKQPESLATRLKFLMEWGMDAQITKFSDAWPIQDPVIGDPKLAPIWIRARTIALRTHAASDPAKALSDLSALQVKLNSRFQDLTAPLEADLHAFYLRDTEATGRLGQIAFQFPNSDVAKTAKVRVGDLFRVAGRYKEAIAQYQSLGTKAPADSLPAQDRAFSIAIRDLLENEDRSAALAKLSEWEWKHPMAKFDSDFLLLRARTLMLFGRWDEARVELESFEKVQPDSPYQIDAEFFQARILFEKGQKAEARKIWNNIIKSYPRHELVPAAKTWAAKP